MREESSKGTSVTNVVKFRDPSGRIAKLLESGMPVTDVIRMFKDLLVGAQRIKGNVFLREGINFIWDAISGRHFTNYFDNNSCIGVGDGTAPEDPSQTGLTGTNKTYKKVDAGYPTVAETQITFRATFGPNEAVHCYTPDHEILTVDGWKPIIDVREGEYVATIAPDGKIVYQPVATKTVFHYRGYIYMIENRFISLAVTPNHKVYVRNDWLRRNGGGFDLLEVQELEKGTWEMLKSGRWDGMSPKEFVVEGINAKFHSWLKDPLYLPAKPFVRLLGYILSEGYVARNYVVIFQSKNKHPDRYNEILELAKECGFNPRESRRNSIWINDKRLAMFINSVAYNGGSRATHKRVPKFVKDLSPELIREFLDVYFKGDGSLGGGKTIQIHTTSQHIRDDLQELALKAGLCADYYEHTNPYSFSTRTKYVVSIKHRYCSPYAVYRHDDKKKSEIVKVPYDGLMVGIGVPEYHTLYVRRKGKAVWSGNSWQEWTVANDCNDDAVNLNRRVANLGSKPADATWVLEVTLSIS
jgi:intein/homing endonuclease